MDAENLLISKIVKHGDLRPVLDAKVTGEFFADDEHREVFSWVLKHWSRYGSVPGTKALKSEFPAYTLVDGKEPYEFYLDELKRRRKYELTFGMLVEASGLIEEDDTEAALDVLASSMLKIHTEVSELRDTNIVDTWEQRLERYDEWREFGDRLRGIPSGFPTIDRTLRGFQEEQLITFVGVPKAGKSTMLMRMAIAAHEYGKVPLFIGFEMSNEEQEARHDAMIAGISYSKLLEGRLPADQREMLAKALRRRKEMHDFVLSSDIEGATVSGIAAKIDQYKPHIVFVDGVYLMDDEEGEEKGSPQALTHITRSLKRLAQRTRTPIVITTQVLLWKLGKKGLHGGAIGYSSSFLQDSDVLMGVEHTGDEEDPIKKVSVLEARSAPRRSVLISWDWETGSFTELDEAASVGEWGMESDEDEDAFEEDDAPEEPEPEEKPKRRVVRKRADP